MSASLQNEQTIPAEKRGKHLQEFQQALNFNGLLK